MKSLRGGRARRAAAIAACGIVSINCSVVSSKAWADSAPFQDPNVNGTITLCNQQLHPITSGSLYDKPFVWRAVSSAPAPKGYTFALLYVAQPIQHVDPSSWAEMAMTGTTTFSNPAHAMAQATYHDQALLSPYVDIPPYWSGYYQLRMNFSSPNTPAWTTSYPAAVIRVSGSAWTLVQGGGGSCTDGNAISTSIRFLPKSETQTPQTIPQSVRDSLPTVPGVPTTPPQTHPTSSPPKQSSASSPAGPAVAAPTDSASGSSFSPAGSKGSSWGDIGIAAAIIAVLVAAAVGGLLVRHQGSRRRAAAAVEKSPPTSPDGELQVNKS